MRTDTDNIAPLILCRGPHCLGKTGEIDDDCPRCGGLNGDSPGIDPLSLHGCVGYGEEDGTLTICSCPET